MKLSLLAKLKPAGGETWITELPTLSAWNEVVLEFGLSRPVKMTGDTVIVPTAGLLLVIGTRMLVDAGNSVCVPITFRVVGSSTTGIIVNVVSEDVVVVLKLVPKPLIAKPDGSTVIVALAGLNPCADALICTVPGAAAVP